MQCYWPSRGDRLSLAESIESIACNSTGYGYHNCFIVVFECNLEDCNPLLVARLKNLSGQSGIRVQVIDRKIKKLWLADSTLPVDQARLTYSLYSPGGIHSSGCNRNAILLHAAGNMHLVTDDDLFARTVVWKNPEKTSKKKHDQTLPVRMCHCAEAGNFEEELTTQPVNICQSHLQYLGQMGSEPGRKILLSSPGTYGDSGFSRSHGIMFDEGNTWKRKIATGYEQLRYSRLMIRMADTDTEGQDIHLLGMQTGFDGTELLPPFFPFGRNEDSLFALMTRICHPSSETAWLGWALEHRPEPPRTISREELIGFRPHLSELIMAQFIQNLPPSDLVAPADRLRSLGDHIQFIGSLPVSDMTETLHTAWADQAVPHAQKAEHLLKTERRRPEAWKIDMTEHLECVNRLLGDPDLLFSEKGCGLSAEEAGSHIRQYGALLQCWPEIYEWATERNHGNPLPVKTL